MQHIDLTEKEIESTELNTIGISGIIKTRIINTGGASASEGGMGTGDSDGKEKGEISSNKSGGNSDKTDKDFDPVGKDIKKKEKEIKREEK
jgi:hypothetical protein